MSTSTSPTRGSAGLEIRHVFLTHLHADFVAGHLELRERTGAQIYLGRAASAEYPFTPLGDGDAVEFGDVRLSVLETPGHSPESISIVVYDRAEGRRGAVRGADGGHAVHRRRGPPRPARGARVERPRSWPACCTTRCTTSSCACPTTRCVYPTHGAGSLCGKNLSTDTVSTIGAQRRYNYALAADEQDEFIEIVLAEQPDAPAYFTYDAILNTKERPTLEQALRRELRPLALDEVLRAAEPGAQLLDTREPVEFEGAHLLDSVNISLAGQFATWAGTLLDPARPIVVMAEPGREVEESAMRLGRIGFDPSPDDLSGGMAELSDGRNCRRIERSPRPRSRSGSVEARPSSLDVRAPANGATERIEGSRR